MILLFFHDLLTKIGVLALEGTQISSGLFFGPTGLGPSQ
jgi:hypothetical protein